MEKTIQLPSKSIHIQWINYNLIGEEQPILVFLHEALGSIVQWKSFPQNLCNALQMTGLVIERTGHGQSSPLTEPRTAKYLHAYADETLEVLQEVLAPKIPFILIGHSDGGSIALILGSRRLPQLKAIVTMAAHTFVEEETLAGIHPAIEAYKQGKLDGLKRIHGEKTEQLFYAWADTWLHPEFRSWDIREEIKTIEIPVLALQGVKDQYGTEKQVDSITSISKINHGQLLSNCGHHPHLEKADEVIQIIEKWVQNQLLKPS